MNKPYFMTNKSWYVTIPPKKRIPEHPDIDIALTRKAEDDIYLGEGECIRLKQIYDTIDEG